MIRLVQSWTNTGDSKLIAFVWALVPNLHCFSMKPRQESFHTAYSILQSIVKFYVFVILGTPFMVRLHEQLKFFVNYKISTDPAWQGLRIYLSGHEVCDLCFLFLQLAGSSPWLVHYSTDSSV